MRPCCIYLFFLAKRVQAGFSSKMSTLQDMPEYICREKNLCFLNCPSLIPAVKCQSRLIYYACYRIRGWRSYCRKRLGVSNIAQVTNHCHRYRNNIHCCSQKRFKVTLKTSVQPVKRIVLEIECSRIFNPWVVLDKKQVMNKTMQGYTSKTQKQYALTCIRYRLYIM